MRRPMPENKKTRKVLKLENKTVVKNGIGFGSVLAITISWSVNHSILWAIIHGCLSWLYVVYYALVRQKASNSVCISSGKCLKENGEGYR